MVSKGRFNHGQINAKEKGIAMRVTIQQIAQWMNVSVEEARESQRAMIEDQERTITIVRFTPTENPDEWDISLVPAWRRIVTRTGLLISEGMSDEAAMLAAVQAETGETKSERN